MNAVALRPETIQRIQSRMGLAELTDADIEETFEQCTKLLKETDFENEVLFYVSSW